MVNEKTLTLPEIANAAAVLKRVKGADTKAACRIALQRKALAAPAATYDEQTSAIWKKHAHLDGNRWIGKGRTDQEQVENIKAAKAAIAELDNETDTVKVYPITLDMLRQKDGQPIDDPEVVELLDPLLGCLDACLAEMEQQGDPA